MAGLAPRVAAVLAAMPAVGIRAAGIGAIDASRAGRFRCVVRPAYAAGGALMARCVAAMSPVAAVFVSERVPAPGTGGQPVASALQRARAGVQDSLRDGPQFTDAGDIVVACPPMVVMPGAPIRLVHAMPPGSFAAWFLRGLCAARIRGFAFVYAAVWAPDCGHVVVGAPALPEIRSTILAPVPAASLLVLPVLFRLRLTRRVVLALLRRILPALLLVLVVLRVLVMVIVARACGPLPQPGRYERRHVFPVKLPLRRLHRHACTKLYAAHLDDAPA